METQFISTKDAAARLGITPMRIRALISAGRLPSQLIGRDHLIKESDLALVSDRKAGRPNTSAANTAPNPPHPSAALTPCRCLAQWPAGWP